MGRLPFDPRRMRAREQAAARQTGAAPDSATTPTTGSSAGATPALPAALSVSQLAASVDGVLRAGLPRSVRVIGEVSNFTDRTHWYFALKDSGAVISCVMFRTATRRAGFSPQVGQEVVATGVIELYAPQGRLTFRVESLEPVGAGALELAYRRLCEELRVLGWFAPERKRPLPAMPRRIGVITSRTGAALQDVLDTARRRAPFVEICVVDTLVQGPAAAPGVARAIAWVSANARRLGIDLIIVTRGGGSLEDLWAFNDRAVAEAIVHCSIPVAAAIGHETDTTIAELVADCRCATPTQAAMRCTPDAGALREQVHAISQRLAASLRAGVRRATHALDATSRHLAAAAQGRAQRSGRALERLAARLEACRPAALYERRRSALTLADQALRSALNRRIADARARAASAGPALTRAAHIHLRQSAQQLGTLARSLELVGPAGVLARGYSITLGADGRAIRAPADVASGDVIHTRLARGEITSTVNDANGRPSTSPPPRMPPAPSEVHPPSPAPAPPPPSRRSPPARKKPSAGDGEPGLFGSGEGSS